jgi:hypothetical protein
MSALPPNADIRQRIEHVRFVPQADIVGGAKKTRALPLVADLTLLLVASQPKTSKED